MTYVLCDLSALLICARVTKAEVKFLSPVSRCEVPHVFVIVDVVVVCNCVRSRKFIVRERDRVRERSTRRRRTYFVKCLADEVVTYLLGGKRSKEEEREVE